MIDTFKPWRKGLDKKKWGFNSGDGRVDVNHQVVLLLGASSPNHGVIHSPHEHVNVTFWFHFCPICRETGVSEKTSSSVGTAWAKKQGWDKPARAFLRLECFYLHRSNLQPTMVASETPKNPWSFPLFSTKAHLAKPIFALVDKESPVSIWRARRDVLSLVVDWKDLRLHLSPELCSFWSNIQRHWRTSESS